MNRARVFGLRTWSRSSVSLLIVGVLVVVGLSATAAQAVSAARSSDFTLTVTPRKASTAAGASVVYTATLFSKNKFDADVSLKMKGLPKGATGVFDPPSPVHLSPGGSRVVELIVDTATDTPHDTSTLTITAKAAGKKHTADVTLKVKPPADFSVTVSPTRASTHAGTTETFTATVKPRHGFTGTVDLAPGDLPAGLDLSVTPSSLTFDDDNNAEHLSRKATVTVEAALTTTPDSYPLSLIATSGTLSHDADFELRVTAPRGIALTIDPATASVAQTDSAKYAVTVTRTDVSGKVKLVVDGLPAGTTATFSPNPIPARATRSTLTVHTTKGTPVDTHALNVTGTLRDTVQDSATATLIVGVGGEPFTISGDLEGLLYPGIRLPLDLTFDNPNSVPITITDLWVAITGIDQAHADQGCTLDPNFAARQFRGKYKKLVVAKTLTLSDTGIDPKKWPQIVMVETGISQDACRNATLTLTYGGSARGGTP